MVQNSGLNLSPSYRISASGLETEKTSEKKQEKLEHNKHAHVKIDERLLFRVSLTHNSAEMITCLEELMLTKFV